MGTEGRLQLPPGSSPLTRGKRLVHRRRGGRRRLIPAHAGKTPRSIFRTMALTAHPRSRGENRPISLRSSRLDGSSPLTRGKRDRGSAGPRAAGLIPAHAGKTSLADLAAYVAWAHPRSRGENSAGRAGIFPGIGSSPLTRGKRHDHCDRLEGLRLIPAHAGKT